MNAAKLQRRRVKPYFWKVMDASERQAAIQTRRIELRFARLRQTSFRFRVRGRLQARFFTSICPMNSGQCSIEHLSIVLSHQTETATGAILFDRFSASQRATLVAITHAMMNTSIVDAKGRDETVVTLGLVGEMTDVHGENQSSPSDQQFQLFARLMPMPCGSCARRKTSRLGRTMSFIPVNHFRSGRCGGLQ